jgi:hypothetical protein
MYLQPTKQPLLPSSRTFLVLAQILALEMKINFGNETYYRQSLPKQRLFRDWEVQQIEVPLTEYVGGYGLGYYSLAQW